MRCPYCGGHSEFVKLYSVCKRYDGFMRCNDCGREGRLYTSKQNAERSWSMEKMRKRYNKLMCEIGADHMVSDSMSLSDMVAECKYWLECLHEEGSSMYDLKYDEPKLWRSWVGKLKRFIRRFENENS